MVSTVERSLTSRALLDARPNESKLASQNNLFLVPGMRFAAMATGHSAGLELGRGKGFFFDHHPCNVELFCYRTSHQDSLDHSVTMSHQRLKARANLFLLSSFSLFGVPGFLSNKTSITLNKDQQAFELGWSRLLTALIARPYEHQFSIAF